MGPLVRGPLGDAAQGLDRSAVHAAFSNPNVERVLINARRRQRRFIAAATCLPSAQQSLNKRLHVAEVDRAVFVQVGLFDFTIRELLLQDN